MKKEFEDSQTCIAGTVKCPRSANIASAPARECIRKLSNILIPCPKELFLFIINNTFR